MAVSGAGRSSSLVRTPSYSGALRLTPRQEEINALMGGPQRHTLLVGGARSGKTALICRAILIRALMAKNSRHAILRFRANAARSAIWLDTLPKIARATFPGLELIDHRQDGFIGIPASGSQIWVGGLDERERVEKVLGLEFLTLYLNECSEIPYASAVTALTRLAQTVPGVRQRAYYDLNPVGNGHWTYRLFIQKIEPETKLPLSDPDNYQHAFVSPLDNAENLSAEYLESLRNLPPRQRHRFFEGVYVDEVEGALWTFEHLAHARCEPEDVPTTKKRIAIGVDPSGASGETDAQKRSDMIGIVVVALCDDDRLYVLEDLTCNLAPEAWGRRVAHAYEKWSADIVVAEKNFGGAMVESTIRAANKNINIKLVDASRGKAVRAEPVSVLYGWQENGEWRGDRVRHAGNFPELEEELLNFSTAGYAGPKSPDRADSCVWAITELALGKPMTSFGLFELIRQQSEALDAKRGAAKRGSYGGYSTTI